MFVWFVTFDNAGSSEEVLYMLLCFLVIFWNHWCAIYKPSIQFKFNTVEIVWILGILVGRQDQWGAIIEYCDK